MVSVGAVDAVRDSGALKIEIESEIHDGCKHWMKMRIQLVEFRLVV